MREKQSLHNNNNNTVIIGTRQQRKGEGRELETRDMIAQIIAEAWSLCCLTH